jgi:SAM-dependent methyltransferase
MTREASIIELGQWLTTPPGRYLLAWEQACLDECVVDVFGYHALQLGLPQLEALRANRMPNQWLADEAAFPSTSALAPLPQAAVLHCQAEALPFADQSLDLVVMPHTLELAQDPHAALAEVSRVLRPEGRVIVTGLNPASLWGLRQHAGRVCAQVGWRGKGLFLPQAGDFLGYWRLRDWLKLLNFEIEQVQFGCYRPPLSSQRWLDRFEWLDGAAPRWWPVLGAVYAVSAVKRVRGVRLVGLARRERGSVKAAPAAVANRFSRDNNKP